MRIHPQSKEVEEVVQIDLPVPLRIGGEGEVDPREFAGDIFGQQPAVGIGRFRPQLLPAVDRAAIEVAGGGVHLPALIVQAALIGELLVVRFVEQQRQETVAGAEFVDGRRAVSNPLSRDEHRHGAVKLELDHLARRRMRVAPQIAHETARLADAARAGPVADASRRLHVGIRAHVVDERDESVVEDGEIPAEDLLGRRDGRSPGGFHELPVPLQGGVVRQNISS